MLLKFDNLFTFILFNLLATLLCMIKTHSLHNIVVTRHLLFYSPTHDAHQYNLYCGTLVHPLQSGTHKKALKSVATRMKKTKNTFCSHLFVQERISEKNKKLLAHTCERHILCWGRAVGGGRRVNAAEASAASAPNAERADPPSMQHALLTCGRKFLTGRPRALAHTHVCSSSPGNGKSPRLLCLFMSLGACAHHGNANMCGGGWTRATPRPPPTRLRGFCAMPLFIILLLPFHFRSELWTLWRVVKNWILSGSVFLMTPGKEKAFVRITKICVFSGNGRVKELYLWDKKAIVETGACTLFCALVILDAISLVGESSWKLKRF